jgi:hypothetical protein
MISPPPPVPDDAQSEEPTGAPQLRTCRNCGTPAPASYCPTCGQSTADPRVPFRQLVSEVADDIFSLNGALPQTLFLLLFRPGRLTVEYLAGRRARYLPPVRLYLLTSFVYFFVVFGLSRDAPQPEGTGVSFQVAQQDEFEISGVPFLTRSQEARLEARLRATAELGPGALDRHIRSELAARVPIAVFLLVPLFAALLQLVHLRSRRFYAEHFIVALHLHAFAFLVFSLIALVPWSPVAGVLMILFAAYVVVALCHVYQQRLVRTLAKLAAVSLVYGGALVVTLVTIVVFAALTAPL